MKKLYTGIFMAFSLLFVNINFLHASAFYMKDEIIDYLISDSETIDHDKAMKMVSNCDLHLCQAYKAFFLLKSQDTLSRKQEKEIVNIVNSLIKSLYSTNSYNSDNESSHYNSEILFYDRKASFYDRKITLKNKILSIISSSELFEELSEKIQNDINVEYAYVPLWITLEEPKILEFLEERWSLTVKSKESIRDLPSVKLLLQQLSLMEHGRWITTSYNTHRGTINIDLAASAHNFEDKLSYAPEMIDTSTNTKDALLPLYSWSFKGLWNKQQYEVFQQLFDNSATEIKEYYQASNHLKPHAKNANKLLAAYVFSRFPSATKSSGTKAFKVFHNTNQPLTQLKKQATKFSQHDWNISLSMAIINKEPLQKIQWLLESGANPNAIINYETPLMKAVTQPKVTSALLKYGAKTNIETPYGKTALFYAIQYNQLDTTTLLVEAGANVNKKLYDKAKFEEINHDIADFDFALENIAGFNPLIYSFKYGSEELSKFLVEHKANLGGITLDKFEQWVIENMSLSALHVRIRNLKIEL